MTDNSEDNQIYYFCYGSNLWSKRIKINVRTAQKYGNGLLKDWKLAFSGNSTLWSGASANIVQQNNDNVWGTIWTISAEDLQRLDKQEVGYNRIEVNVSLNGSDRLIKCYTYVQNESYSANTSLPSLAYRTVILNGAVEQQLPEEYIRFIESFETNGILETGPPDLKL